jgi:hypothetical protein
MSRILDRELGEAAGEPLRPRLPSLFEPGLLALARPEPDEEPDATAWPRGHGASAADGDPGAAAGPADGGRRQAAPPAPPRSQQVAESATRHEHSPPRRTQESGPAPARATTGPRTPEHQLPGEAPPARRRTPAATPERSDPTPGARPPRGVEPPGPETVAPAGPRGRGKAPSPAAEPARAVEPAAVPAPVPAPRAPVPPVAAGPIVRITIGRVDVRTATPGQPRTPGGGRPSPRRTPRLSLADYLDTRSPGQRP